MKFYADYSPAKGTTANIPKAQVNSPVTVTAQTKQTLGNAQILNEFRDKVHPYARFTMKTPTDVTINPNVGIDFGLDMGSVVIEDGGLFQSPLVTTLDTEVLDPFSPSLNIINEFGEQLTITDSVTLLSRKNLADRA